MNKTMMLCIKIFVWIFLMLLIAGSGAYLYFETFVDGSMTGLNPQGMLILLASGIAACILFWAGLRRFLPQVIESAMSD